TMYANDGAHFYFKRQAKRVAASKARSGANSSTHDDPDRIPIPQISDFYPLRTIHTSNKCTITQVIKCSNIAKSYTLKAFSKNSVRRKSVSSGVMADLDVYKRITSARDLKSLHRAVATFQYTDNLYLLMVSFSTVSCHLLFFPHQSSAFPF